MDSLINQIKALRKDDNLSINLKNTNRYKVVINEKNNTQTAYCFSNPIYNNLSGKLVSLNFSRHSDSIIHIGSNSSLQIFNNLAVLVKDRKKVSIHLNNAVTSIETNRVLCGPDCIYPSVNGMALRIFTNSEGKVSLDCDTSEAFLDIRNTDNCFVLMEGWLKPLLSVSAIGTSDFNNNINMPVHIDYKKITPTRYNLTFSTKAKKEQWFLIEFNMYEEKIINDTIISSKHPETNNAYGSVAFVGQTESYGNQWVYLRTNNSLLFENQIRSAILHIPILGNTKGTIQAYELPERFCSFGTTWKKKISSFNQEVPICVDGKYLNVNLLNSYSSNTHINRNGYLLKGADSNSCFAISSGDSCYFSQILEINYK